MGILGLAILFFALYSAINDLQNLGTLDTVRLVLLPIVLSAALLPFVYLLLLYSTYERLFVNLNIGPKKSDALKNYAKRKLVLGLNLNYKKARTFLRKHHRDLVRVQTKADVEALLIRFRDTAPT